MSNLLAEHIKVNSLIWYSGFTSRGRWNCPAIITKVDERGKYFWVRSLDDMKVQDSRYHFTCGPHDPDSRKSMRTTSFEEVADYLRRRKAEPMLRGAERQAFLKGLESLPEELTRLLDAAA